MGAAGREGKEPDVGKELNTKCIGGLWSVHRGPVAPAFLLLSLLVVTASLLALPLNCPFVVLDPGVDTRFALLM